MFKERPDGYYEYSHIIDFTRSTCYVNRLSSFVVTRHPLSLATRWFYHITPHDSIVSQGEGHRMVKYLLLVREVSGGGVVVEWWSGGPAVMQLSALPVAV